MAANKLELYRGVTYDFRYNHTDTAGAPVPLTSCTVYFTVKTAKFDTDTTDSTAAIKKTVTSHIDAAGGITSWTLNDADMEITPGKYYYGVIVENAAGLSAPPSLLGELIVLPQTTNRNVGNE
jgi:hypothetical protein